MLNLAVRKAMAWRAPNLSEGAELYAQYTAIRNRANGTYNFGDGLNIVTASGAKLSGLGAGMAYAF